MDAKTLLKLSLMGMLMFFFVAPAAYAEDSDDAEEVETPKRSKKSKKKKKAPAATRMVVAINKFDNKSDAPDSLFETIRSRVQQCIVGARKFEVVEREQLKAAMSEQTLAASGLTDSEDDADAPEAGKMKAASYIVYGTVLYCGKDQAGGASEGVATAVVKSKVELQIKITNGETGKILTQKSAIGYGVDKALATAEFKSSTGQGMRDAIDEACHMAADALRDVAYPAKIIRVGKKAVTINMTDEEVKEDDVFDVIEAEDLGMDPDTGAWLGFDGDDVGRVVITRTGPQTSRATPAEGSDLDLDELDTDENMYILRRVSKTTLKKEAKKASRKRKAAFESRF